MSYIQLTTPLVLHADPVLPGHAVTKRYVDGKKAFLQASWFTSGVVSALRMPALSGDVSSVAGSGVTALSDSGVVAGSYTKVTVNSSGRVTGGGYLAAVDVPSVDWSKVTTGKPTTAAGYGINNLIALSGGTASGHIASTAVSTDNLHAVTKAYVDNNVTGVVSASLSVGDVVRKATDVTPSGFLRCNGGYVSKVDYAGLYAIMGELLFNYVTLDYTSYAAIGSGQPWRQQYDFNTEQSGDITGWTTGTPLSANISMSQAVVTKNRIYLLGGHNSNATYTAIVNSDGTLGSWTSSGTLPSEVHSAQAIVTRNRVYLIGRYGYFQPALASVYTATINTDGTLGTWVASGNLVTPVYNGHAFVTKSKVYLMGGNTTAGVGNETIQSATIATDGTLGPWSTVGSTTGVGVISALFVTKNKLYVITNTASYVTTIDANGIVDVAGWLAGPSIPTQLARTNVITTKNRVYLLGGSNAATGLVYTAAINSDGSIGTWTAGTALVEALYDAQVVVVKNKLYILGNNSSNVVRYATFSGGLNGYSKFYDGSINKFDNSNVSGSIAISDKEPSSYTMPGAGKPWQQQSGINTTQNGDIVNWNLETSSPTTSPYYGFETIVTKNRVYLLGGINGSTLSSTVYTAPINSDGTLGSWTTSTSLPGTIYQSQAIVTKNRVYLLGGIINGSVSSTVYTAPINTDGTLGTWTTSTSLPGTVRDSQAIVTKNRVYLLGGYSNYSTNTIYTAPINLDGTLGAWTTSGNIPYYLESSQVVVTKNRVYLLGGYSGASPLQKVYSAIINLDGTLDPWVTESVLLPATVYNHRVYVTGNKIYLICGTSSTGVLSSDKAIYVAPINQDGTLGQWNRNNDFPTGSRDKCGIFSTGSKLYIIGGTGASTVYSTPITGGLNDYSPYYDGTITPYTVDEPSYTMPGNGQPWRQQWDINTTQNGDITGWTTSTSLPSAVAYSQAIVTKNRVYLLGGYINGTDSSTVYTAPINTDGTLGTWTTSTSLPATVSSSQTIVTKNRIYLLGGAINGSYSSTVYTAPINTDGTLGTWSTGTPLPGIFGQSVGVLTKNRVYLLGGRGGSTVYTAPINLDGTLGTWTTAPSLPYANGINFPQVVVTKNRVYLLGGDASGTLLSTVYTASINTDGTLGTWATSTSLPGTVYYSQAIVTKNRVYLLGGYINGAPSSSVYTAPINDDGTLGAWTTSTSLPATVYLSQAIVTKNRVYLLAGYMNGGPNSAVLVAPITGGLSDYSPYYDGTFQPIDPTTSFRLPDYTTKETDGINFYIKY